MTRDDFLAGKPFLIPPKADKVFRYGHTKARPDYGALMMDGFYCCEVNTILHDYFTIGMFPFNPTIITFDECKLKEDTNS